jgi:hypothetical protein
MVRRFFLPSLFFAFVALSSPMSHAQVRAPTQDTVKQLNRDELVKATVEAKAAFEKATDPKGKPSDKSEDWKRVLKLVDPVLATLDKMDKDDPGFDKQRFKDPLWWQTKATKETKGDAQPGFDRYLALFGKELSLRDLTIVLREQYFFLVETAPPDPGPARTQRHRDAVTVIESALKVINKSVEEDPFKVIIAVDVGMAHQRLVTGEDGVNHYEVAQGTLEAAKKKVETAEAALDADKLKEAQDIHTAAQKELDALSRHAQVADEHFKLASETLTQSKTMKIQQKLALQVLIAQLRSLLKQSIGHDPSVPE